MSVTLILDTSALLAYSVSDPAQLMANLNLCELVAEVAEDPLTTIGVPAVCFLEAHRACAADPDATAALQALRNLCDADTVAVLPLPAGDHLPVAGLDQAVGPAVGGHAAQEARRHGAPLATCHPDAARWALPAHQILNLTQEM